jgi:hypothetical protein
MKLSAFRHFNLFATILCATLALSACNGKADFFRFQLINQTPYEVTFFVVAESEAGLDTAVNLLAEPIPGNAMAEALVSGPGQYWLRAIADVDGTSVEHTRGPMTMTDGNVGWAWRVEGETVVEGADAASLYAQVDLPAVIIETNGQAILDDPKISATMHIIDGGEGVLNSPDPALATFSSPIGIETRGNSSQTFAKKSFGLELQDGAGSGTDAELLGMPTEEDWVLYGPWMDRSLVRNVFGYNIWSDLGWYAPRSRYCELYVHEDPAVSLVESYEGLYVLTEKIKRDTNRVNIASLSLEDTTEPAITGGYLLEIMKPDRLDADEVGLPLAGDFVASLVYPSPDKITDVQQAWIQNYLAQFETALFGANFTDSDLGYRRFINEESFIDYMILQEYFKNRDAFHSSTFFYKDRDDLIHMGPIWDLNIAMGYFSFAGHQETTGFILNTDEGQIARSSWARRLLEDDGFKTRYKARWNELRDGVLSTASVNGKIDGIVAELDTAQARQFLRWKTLGYTLFPDIRYLMFTGPHPDSYQGEVEYLKDWLQERAEWIDANLDLL